jgi:uncharacterized membrane protein
VTESTADDPAISQEEGGELDPEGRQLIAQITASRFSGPVPPPAVLGQYEEILPGSAERILSMAENEQSHRHYYDNGLLGLFTRGQWFAFILGLAAIGAGTYLLSIGQDLGGFTSLILGLGPIIAALLFRRKYPLPKLSSDEPSTSEEDS